MSTDTGIPPPTWFREVFVLLVPSLLIPAFFLLVRRSRSEPNPYAYEKLGIDGASNLSDEHDPKYAGAKSTGSKSDDWEVKAIMCHPIKSCRGIELNVAKIDGSGILWDRKFIVAEWKDSPPKRDEKATSGWMFRTLRAPGYENLARVKTEIWLRKGSDTDGLLIVRYPFIPTGSWAWAHRILMMLKLSSNETFFQVPLDPPEKHDYPKEQVVLFGDSPTWLNYQRHVPQSLQTLVKAEGPVTLFRVDPSQYREVHGNAPKVKQLGYQPIVGGADSYPLSIQNLASVRAVAREVREDIPTFTIRRLRPNIIATGGAAFDEDDWQRLQIGDHEIFCSCHTTRCKLPCVDPDSAIRHPKQPEAYLRKNRNVDQGAPNTGCLGLQMVPATNKRIEIKVGDPIVVLERGKHHYLG